MAECRVSTIATVPNERYRRSYIDHLAWVIAAIVAIAYFSGLTPGHVFVQDDFAAYVMHAANLVEGRSYTSIRYVANPEAPWVSPANGYPPVYPMLLAPLYLRLGMDLRAMKMATVATFGVFLWSFALWVKPIVSPGLRAVLVALVGMNPALWSYRDLISSEFPYLMFSFLALLALGRESNVGGRWKQAGWALLTGFLLYACYGTRTIGIALVGAAVVAEVCAHRRPRRFLVFGTFAGLAILQSLLLTSPTGYAAMVQFSARALLMNVVDYAKALSHAWENGFSLAVQGGLTLVLTGFAGIAFWKRIRQGMVDALYLAIYLAILLGWGAQVGVRGLLPVLPIYLTYVVLGIRQVVEGWQWSKARWVVGSVAGCVLLTYVGGLQQPPWQASLANVKDASAQELFAFLRTETQPSELLLFSKPRTLALYSGRASASLAPDEAPIDSARFLQEKDVRFVIQAAWSPASYARLLSEHAGEFEQVFGNRDFRVFRVRQEADRDRGE